MAQKSLEKRSRSIRVLEILETMASKIDALSISEIATATGLPKATAHRLCALLEQEGFLAADIGGNGLRPGHRMRELALGMVATGGNYAYRHRILTELSRSIGETCNLNAPMGSEMVYLDRVEADWPLRTQLPIGTRVPLHCTASGKLYLSSLSATLQHRLVGALPLERHTPKTITDTKDLLAELDRIRDSGIGTDDEEFIDGMTAVAVSLLDAKGRVVGTLACHAPSVRMNIGAALGHVPAMRQAADMLSAERSE
jgi:DNA-binding IclR family transcriptional regulator